MTDANGAGWLRGNVKTVVAWALIAAVAAASYGATYAGMSSVQSDVVGLELKAETAAAERAVLRGDVRVNEAQRKALEKRVDRFVVGLDRLESATRTLEALGGGR